MSKLIEVLHACGEGAEYVESCDSYKQAWDSCKRGDWMLWVAEKRLVDFRTLLRTRAKCAKLAEHLTTDERVANALRVAECFANGEAVLDAFRAAVYEAAVADHDAAVVLDSAYTATNRAAGYAASSVAAACSGSVVYSDRAAAHAAKSIACATGNPENKTLKQCADICRQYIKFEDLRIDEL